MKKERRWVLLPYHRPGQIIDGLRPDYGCGGELMTIESNAGGRGILRQLDVEENSESVRRLKEEPV